MSTQHVGHPKYRHAVSLLAVAVGLLALVLAASGSAVAAPTTITDCTTIGSSGEYNLSASIVDSDYSTCITIAANDVEFDGNGFLIDAGISGDGAAVHVSDGFTNVTVRNVTLTDWEQGVYYGGNDGRIANVSATVSTGSDIYVGFNVTGSNNHLADNNVEGRTGIRITGTGNTLDNNDVTGGLIGIHINRSDTSLAGGSVTGMDLSYSVGIQVDANASNVSVSDVQIGNWTDGIYSEGDEGEIASVTVTVDTADSAAEALRIVGSNNLVRDSTATGEDDFWIDGSNNTVTRNVALSAGFQIRGDGNDVTHNVDESANGIGVSGDYNYIFNGSIESGDNV